MKRVIGVDHIGFNKRKEVIRCLMVQQWGRFSSFGGFAAELVIRAVGASCSPERCGFASKAATWSSGLELSGR